MARTTDPAANPELAPYLRAALFVDSDDPHVRAFAAATTAGARDPLERAVRLYYAVRDGIRYDVYWVGDAPAYYRASDCLRAGRGFCIPKAALLAATARAAGIPARVSYADVRNHLATRRLLELLGTDLFVWHGLTELHLDGRWVKATPAFNRTLCERFGVRPLEFDGRQDSLLHEYDGAGRRHMQYLRSRGHYADVPYEAILADFRRLYPRLMALGAQGPARDFAQEAEAERGGRD